MKRLFTALIAMMLLMSAGCGSSSDPVPQPKSAEKSITSYSINGVAGTINETEKTITVAMPYGTDVSAMVATYTTTGSSVKIGAIDQVSAATTNDFSGQVTYKVTAADATVQGYTVTVTVAQASSKSITSYSLNGVAGTIDETNKTIAVTFPFGTPLTNRIAKFTATAADVKVGSTVQVSGSTVNDFTNPVIYRVTAADKSTQDYTVTVTLAPSSAKAITAYSLNGSAGTINESNKTIAVTMPFGVYIKDLVAAFTTTGQSVKVGPEVQVSGTTAHNFTDPVTYTVVAADNTTQDYVVTVTVAKSPEKAITAFSVNGISGIINETSKTIAVTMPASTKVTSLVATFTTTGQSVKVGSTVQASGKTANNFTSPVTYTVTAADGTTADYLVTVTRGAWHHPASLSDNITPDGKDAKYAQVAMDKNGNAIIVWQQFDGTNNQIFKSEYRNGVWHHPTSLSDNISPDGQDAEYPQVAMDDNGNAIIVWKQNYSTKSSSSTSVTLESISLSGELSVDGSATLNSTDLSVSYPSRIFKSEYRNGIWTHPASLSDSVNPSGQYALNPRVAMDNSGNAIITWQQDYTTKSVIGSDVTISGNISFANSQIFKREYRNGAWSGAAYVSSSDGQAAGNAQAAMDNNGNAIIAWVQYDEKMNYQIFKSEYRNGVWTGPASSSDHISPNGQDAYDPQLAMDDHGNAIITWRQNYSTKSSGLIVNSTTISGTLLVTSTSWRIFKSEFRNGIWTHPASLSDFISPDGQDANNSRVAMDNNGNALIVWNVVEQKAQSSNTSSPSPVIINSNSVETGLVSTWGSINIETTNYNSRIYMSEYRNGVWHHPSSATDTISPAVQNNYTDYFLASPQAAMDDNGNAVIVWHQFDGSNLKTFVSEYRGGVWHHPASLADSFGPGGQNAGSPVTAMSNNGTAIIAWPQSDGANYQIFKSEYR